MKKKLNINRLLENSRRSDVRGYNIHAIGFENFNHAKYGVYFNKWDAPKPGLGGIAVIGHEISLKNILVPVVRLNGNEAELKAVRNHWTPAFMSTYYRSEPAGEYRRSGLLCLREDKCFTEDDTFVGHITLMNDDKAPAEVEFEIKTPFLPMGEGIYTVDCDVAVAGLMKQMKLKGYAAVGTDQGASVKLTIPANGSVKLRYGFAFDVTSSEKAAAKLERALMAENPFDDAEKRFNEWMERHAPVLDTDNTDVLRVYYYRFYVVKCSLHNPSALLPDSDFEGECVYECPFGGWFGAPIGLPVPLQIEEMKWMRDTASVRSHILNWCCGKGAYHGYIQFTPMAIWHYYLNTGDRALIEEAYEACRKYTLSKCGDNPSALPITVGSWVTGAEYQPPFYQHTEPEWDWRNDAEYLNQGFACTSLIRVDESSMYAANLRACGYMASLLGLKEEAESFDRYADKAVDELIRLCWNGEKGFFCDVDVKTGRQCDCALSYDGYFPMTWGFASESYFTAYDRLRSSDGFDCAFGMTTVDRQCPMYWYDNCITGPYLADYANPHEYGCCWNGPVWPYAFSQALDSLGTAARKQSGLRDTWIDLFNRYTDLHFDFGDRSVPCICENYRPGDGVSFSPCTDYFHSEWLNLLFSHWAGIRVSEEGLEFSPMTEDDFVLENVMICGQAYRFVQETDENGCTERYFELM